MRVHASAPDLHRARAPDNALRPATWITLCIATCITQSRLYEQGCEQYLHTLASRVKVPRPIIYVHIIYST